MGGRNGTLGNPILFSITQYLRLQSCEAYLLFLGHLSFILQFGTHKYNKLKEPKGTLLSYTYFHNTSAA